MIYKLVCRTSNKLFSGEITWSGTKRSSAVATLFLDPPLTPYMFVKTSVPPSSLPRLPSTLEPQPVLCKVRFHQALMLILE